MRKFSRVLAAAGIAVAASVSLPSAASATPPPGCTGGHDGAKYAWASCTAYGTRMYRVTAYNCSPVCGNALGEWAANGAESHLTISWPAKILDIGVEIQ
ncbi:hypothetical protein SD37_28200 [Amycolatopsis orientalis]|uniref:Uncharacterized protein n=1 Tax=Amycolatopsis orientalis TaxID=31958 RepID=A0A193C421_AMYOR|nr:hypothetical protein [Amycolatopsis orientalis]ANN19123.1 hypothetical protein SD37_28200 [Amycolatopsis orientalis]